MAELDEIEDEILAPVLESARRSREPIDLPVKIRAVGMRLDLYLAHALGAEFSRSEIQRAIEAETVLLNGHPTKASYKVRPGDQLRITLPDVTYDAPKAENIPLEILYEDEVLALVNKPADMVVHPAKGNWSGTLVNALQFHFTALSAANGTYRAGIVHRLDRDTSGVILVAKDEKVHRELAMAFEQRRVFKEYIAITAGVPDLDSDYIEVRIRQHPHDRIRMQGTTDPDDPTAKDACSYYEVVERFRGFALVKVQPRTGRTHQIRIHLGSIDCPVLADKVYSGRDQIWLRELAPELPESEDVQLLARQALHAYKLRFLHPVKGTWLEVEAPFPPDMQRTLDALRTHRKVR